MYKCYMADMSSIFNLFNDRLTSMLMVSSCWPGMCWVWLCVELCGVFRYVG